MPRENGDEDMGFLFTKLMLPFFVAISSIAFIAPPAEANPRIVSTNRTSSAPLNLVNRSFARFEKDLAPALFTERLTFLPLRTQQITNHEKMVGKLLLDISGGPHEARLIDLKAIAPTEASIHNALEDFLAHISSNENTKLSSFRTSIKAALTRSDVLLYTAQLLRNDGHSRVLILMDDETKDIVLLLLGQSASH